MNNNFNSFNFSNSLNSSSSFKPSGSFNSSSLFNSNPTSSSNPSDFPKCSIGLDQVVKFGKEAWDCRISLAKNGGDPISAFSECIRPVKTFASNDCIQQHMIHHTMSDPFYSNMPKGKSNLYNAIKYSAALGGEDHDPLVAMGGLLSK